MGGSDTLLVAHNQGQLGSPPNDRQGDIVTSLHLPSIEFFRLATFTVDSFDFNPKQLIFNTSGLSGATNYRAADLFPDTLLVVEGSPSTDNSFTVTKPVGPDVIAITDNTTANPSAGVTITADQFSAAQVEILGGAGKDTLTIDEKNGLPDLGNGPNQPGSILFDGGGGSNTLILKSTAAAPVPVTATYNVGPGTGAGSVTHDDGLGVPLTVYFTNLQPVIDVVPGPLVVNATNAANAINYTEGLDTTLALNPAFGQVSVDNFESMNFSNKTTLTINGLAGSDEINLNNPNTPTGLTGITVNGQDPTASDTLIANGTTAADAINYAPRPPTPERLPAPGRCRSRSPRSSKLTSTVRGVAIR